MDDVRNSVILLPAGSIQVVLGKLLHGASCAHQFWDEALGTSGDDFVVPASQVVQHREMAMAVRVKTHKQAAAQP
jgi:hypothetical protein